MKDLNWRSAFRRAAIFTLIWLLIVYVTSVIWPNSFGIEIPEELPFLAINAVFFFFVFTLFSAFSERRRARYGQRAGSGRSGGKTGGSGKDSGKRAADEGEGGPLKGRPNPNTSRRKARRRR